MGNLVLNGQTVLEQVGTAKPTIGSGWPSGTICGFERYITPITSHQSSTTTYQTITGTQIDYTPVTGSTYVYYSTSFLMTGEDNSALGHFKLLLDYNTVNGAEFTIRQGVYWAGNLIYLEWIFDSWSGPKNILCECREYNASYTFRLHQNVNWDGASDSATGPYKSPVTKIYSIM